MPDHYVALFRGINVGGKNKLPMKDLVKMFTELGCEDVRHYIQSGNIVFKATPAIAAQVPDAIMGQVHATFGFRTPVIVRTAAQMGEVVRNNPFLQEGAAEDALHVMFLADLPGADRIAALDPNRSPGDRFHIRDQEIFLHLPNGVADTKLTNAYFDAKLATISTRNWRTIGKLLEMMTP
jgi:uncharacterized protein (DUF1697 family)